MLSEEARLLGRLRAVVDGVPVVLREVADVAPRPDAGWLALASMPADGRIWAGAARLPEGETIDLSVLEPRNAALERDGLARLGSFFDRLTARHLAESTGDYPQVIVPDGETTRALQLVRARFRTDPDPALRRLCCQIAFWLDSARLDGADAYVDLRRLLLDHLAFPLPPTGERHLPRLLACVESDLNVVAALAARRTCLPDAEADRLSDRLIARAKAIQRGLPAIRWTSAEAEVLASLHAHAVRLMELIERGLDLWAALALDVVDCAQSRPLTANYRYRRGRWVADEPPRLAARPTGLFAAHDLLEREAAAERRRYHLTLADRTIFEEAVLAGEAARATLIERAGSRHLCLTINQPALRLRHGDPVAVRNQPGIHGRLAEGAEGAGSWLLRLDNGVRRAAALAPGCTLELVRRWDEHLTIKRHQCLRVLAREERRPAERRLPRPRHADPAAWYAARRRLAGP